MRPRFAVARAALWFTMPGMSGSDAHVAHEPRMRIYREAREASQALNDLDQLVELDHGLRELVKIRASQINGCAYCLDLHFHTAREAGETQQRLDTIGAWWESPFFTARERAALALTEAVTKLTDGPVPDEVYDEAARHFDTAELAQLIFAIAVINAWNRLAVTAQLQPPVR